MVARKAAKGYVSFLSVFFLILVDSQMTLNLEKVDSVNVIRIC